MKGTINKTNKSKNLGTLGALKERGRRIQLVMVLINSFIATMNELRTQLAIATALRRKYSSNNIKKPDNMPAAKQLDNEKLAIAKYSSKSSLTSLKTFESCNEPYVRAQLAIAVGTELNNSTEFESCNEQPNVRTQLAIAMQLC